MPADREDLYLCTGDDTQGTEFDPHYIYHTAWAARRIIENRPAEHVDLSSYLYFSTILSATVPTRFYDFRPANVQLSNFSSHSANLLGLPFEDGSIGSLSCMHVVEHIGLGRYGDELDPCGDLKAVEEIIRVLAPGGLLYFVVPVGRSRVCFNAHRVYSFEEISGMFEALELIEFSLIPDGAEESGMILNADPGLVGDQEYGCGCFLYRKAATSAS